MTESLLFWTFAILSCGGALAVVMTQNVVRMAFWLVVSLGSVAALFFLLHADFLGAAQLLIYVGGTVVLLVFGVMLTASGPYSQIRTSPAEIILGSAVGGLLLFVMASSVGKVDWAELSGRLPAPPVAPIVVDELLARRGEEAHASASPETAKAHFYAQQQQGRTVRQLGLAFLGLRPDRDLREGVSSSGLSPGYLLPFEIISIHLLVVLIGAAYLARAKRRITVGEAQELE